MDKKLIEKTYIVKKSYILNKCCSFSLFIHQRSKYPHVPQKN